MKLLHNFLKKSIISGNKISFEHDSFADCFLFLDEKLDVHPRESLMSELERNLEQKMGKQKFRILFHETQITSRILSIAERINSDYKFVPELVVIGVLKGAFIFVADLIRHLTVPLRLDFVSVSSYSGKQSTGEVTMHSALRTDLSGKDVLLVEDIIDTGETVDVLIHQLSKLGPRSLRVAALFTKPSQTKVLPFDIDYSGFSLTDEFIVGYGLDCDERYRELPCVVELLE